MSENTVNGLLVKLSKKLLQDILWELPRIPLDIEEDKRTRKVPAPDSKTHLIIYIRYHWLDSEISETLKKLELPFLQERTPINEITKNEIKRRCRILFERERYRPEFDEIRRKYQAKNMDFKPREMHLCGTKQWRQHLERTDREEQKQREERRKYWSKKWEELGLI